MPATEFVVLVVDDEPGFRRAVASALTRAGYHVLVASDGMDARKQARTYDGIIHLLLTDVGLPDMDGLELAATISKERPGIAVMAMSGQSLPIIPPELLKALFQKPFRLSDLVNRVRHEMEKGSSPFT